MFNVDVLLDALQTVASDYRRFYEGLIMIVMNFVSHFRVHCIRESRRELSS